MALPKGSGGLIAAMGGEPSDEEDMDSGSAVAQSFLDAVASKDAAAVKSAFQAMYDECAAGGAGDMDGEIA